MRKLRMFLSASLCLGFAAGIAQAGPNENGTLVIHSTQIAYCGEDTGGYCSLDLDGEDCSTVNSNEGQSTTANVWTIHAAFPDGSSPRLSGVTFGVRYDDDQIFLADYGACGHFELSSGTWPSPFSGTAITWNFAQTDQTNQIYWIAGYEYYGSDIDFELMAHPSQGGNFADDAVPPNLDSIAEFGALGFNGSQGHAPCPVAGDPLGACCAEDGSCTVTTAVDCADEYQGDDTSCEPNPCPLPPATGACCTPDASCTVTTEDDCADEYQGDDTMCKPSPCPLPTGACCVEDGSCTVTTAADCVDEYQGNGTECAPNPCPQPPVLGACCDEDGSCQMTSSDDCDGEYMGDDTDCDPNPCPHPPPNIGACCAPDGTCSMTTAKDCAGEYQGNDTSCDPNPCPQPPVLGACCDEDGSCHMTSSDDCGGEYMGDDTDCDPNPCPPPPPPAIGACCAPDGTCSMTTAKDCAGDYQGDDTSCDPNPCPQPPPTGACCDARSGACRITTGDDCTIDLEFYLGDDIVCDPNPCPWLGGGVIPPTRAAGNSSVFARGQAGDPQGACCVDNTCLMLTEPLCDAAEGQYQGDGTTCDPNPCLETGACCVDNGVCEVITKDRCDHLGGSYQGDDTDCDPNPCDPTPTRESSWGEIKNIYR